MSDDRSPSTSPRLLQGLRDVAERIDAMSPEELQRLFDEAEGGFITAFAEDLAAQGYVPSWARSFREAAEWAQLEPCAAADTSDPLARAYCPKPVSIDRAAWDAFCADPRWAGLDEAQIDTDDGGSTFEVTVGLYVLYFVTDLRTYVYGSVRRDGAPVSYGWVDLAAVLEGVPRG